MSRRTRVLLISVGVIASVWVLIARPWGRGQPIDFSDPDKFVVRTTDESGKELVLKRVNNFASDFEEGIARKVEGWHQTLTLASGSKSGNPANRVETTTEQVHSGEFSLKTYTPARSLTSIGRRWNTPTSTTTSASSRASSECAPGSTRRATSRSGASAGTSTTTPINASPERWMSTPTLRRSRARASLRGPTSAPELTSELKLRAQIGVEAPYAERAAS